MKLGSIALALDCIRILLSGRKGWGGERIDFIKLS